MCWPGAGTDDGAVRIVDGDVTPVGGFAAAPAAHADGGVLWLNGDVVFDPAVLETALPALRAGAGVGTAAAF